MEIAAKAIGRATLLTEEENPYLDLIDGRENDFLTALCELLEIQSRKNATPIVVWPNGPSILH